jgi:hypothetical protein
MISRALRGLHPRTGRAGHWRLRPPPVSIFRWQNAGSFAANCATISTRHRPRALFPPFHSGIGGIITRLPRVASAFDSDPVRQTSRGLFLYSGSHGWRLAAFRRFKTDRAIRRAVPPTPAASRACSSETPHAASWGTAARSAWHAGTRASWKAPCDDPHRPRRSPPTC